MRDVLYIHRSQLLRTHYESIAKDRHSDSSLSVCGQIRRVASSRQKNFDPAIYYYRMLLARMGRL